MPDRKLVLFLVAAMATAAPADVIVQQGDKILGFTSRSSSDAEITLSNWRDFIDESRLEIVNVGYDGIEYEYRGRHKLPWSQVVDYALSNVPEALLDGRDSFQVGSYGPAIASLQQVANDASVREAFRNEANYLIALCWLQLGNRKNAMQQLQSWKAVNSTYTPAVYDYLAKLLVQENKHDEALAAYDRIEKLPNLPPKEMYRAKLGKIDVERARNKFDDAEQALRILVTELKSKPDLKDSLAQALILHAKTIHARNAKDRLDQALGLLKEAEKLDGLKEPTKAGLYAAMGDVIYAQGKPEEARFPYMRVWCLYENQTSLVAHSLFNAGQCFLDLYEGEQDEEKRKHYLIQGMRLISTVGSNYGNQPGAQGAGAVWRKYKDAYEKARGTAEEEEGK